MQPYRQKSHVAVGVVKVVGPALVTAKGVLDVTAVKVGFSQKAKEDNIWII